jgi:hypothetical protein
MVTPFLGQHSFVLIPYFRNSFRGTQSPGARSYSQKVQPLQVRRLQAAAPAREGDQ